MKFTTAYYLLLIYISVMFRPLIPLINDAFSHTFNEAEHISEVHFKYGNNHLQKSLAEASDDTDRSKNHNNSQKTDEVSFHLALQPFQLVNPLSNAASAWCGCYLGKLPFVYLSTQGPPPKPASEYILLVTGICIS